MTAKEILIDELNEDMHPEKVEDVIFWLWNTTLSIDEREHGEKLLLMQQDDL